MRKMLFRILPLLFCSTLTAQTNVYLGQKDMVYPQRAGIYETEADFLKDSVKYMGEYDQARKKIKTGAGFARVLETVNFGETYYKFKEATFFGYKDDMGQRYRIINKHSYAVHSAGAIWLYSNFYRNNLVLEGNFGGKNARANHKGKKIAKYGPCSDITLDYTLGKSTELRRISKWNRQNSEEANQELFASDPEISGMYMNDHNDSYDPDYKNGCMDHIERIIHYADLCNKKHAKQ